MEVDPRPASPPAPTGPGLSATAGSATGTAPGDSAPEWIALSRGWAAAPPLSLSNEGQLTIVGIRHHTGTIEPFELGILKREPGVARGGARCVRG